MTISEQVVKAMPERIYAAKKTEGSNCVVSFDTPSLDYNVEYVRAYLVLFLPVQGAVKKLEWELVSGDHYAEGAGTHYNIYETKPGLWNSVTVKPRNVRLATNVGLDTAKAAAQQDFEDRILSALEPSAARELALEEAAKNCEREAAEVDGLIDDVAYHLRKRAAAIRALSSPDHAEAGKVHEYVQGYELRADNGGGYTPTDFERALIEDAIQGFIADAGKVEGDGIGRGATVWIRVDENKDGSHEFTVTEAIGFDDVPDGEYLFVRDLPSAPSQEVAGS